MKTRVVMETRKTILVMETRKTRLTYKDNGYHPGIGMIIR